MSNTTSAIRASLVDALQRATDGNLSAEDGRNIIGLANQISQSMGTEVKVMTTKLKMGHQVEKFGDLEVS
tara:strand:- start:274 stop:483 length:210 start_codon:yes stop_codon:yes gene_type:complete